MPKRTRTRRGVPDPVPPRPPALDLPLSVRTRLYAARQFLDRDIQERLHIRIPFDVYFQDPLVAASDAELACAADLRLLQSRMLSNALAFAELSSKVTNNTSVVLLIEWRGKRLLFVGDAEWETTYREGKANGAWNVMWHERQPLLGPSIQFLKIGHHGSENATPWDDEDGGAMTEPAQILNAILPLPAGSAAPKARAIVSTMRERFKTIPRSALLVELGKRVANTRDYKAAFTAKHIKSSSLPEFAGYEKTWFAKPQFSRTDLERVLSGAEFLDVEIDG